MTQPESHEDNPTSDIPLRPARPDSKETDRSELADTTELFPQDPVAALLAALRDEIGEQNYQHWFLKRTRFEVSGDRFVAYVSNPFILNWLLRRFRSALNRAAQLVLGLSASCQLEVDESLLSDTAASADPRTDRVEGSGADQKRESAAFGATASSSTRRLPDTAAQQPSEFDRIRKKVAKHYS